ncbi:MAG: lytic murein transglycosylase [Bdellovibrionales bacterium]|jgi:membrane-bound lytic murein transglycosylase B|nr:lytic murein transglycosylase [Bdellovibrionales bacterium]
MLTCFGFHLNRRKSRRTVLVAASVLIAVLGLSLEAHSSVTEPFPDFPYMEKKMLEAGMERSFVEHVVRSYEPKGLGLVVELNVLLFLRKSDYHGIQVTSEGEAAVRQFSNRYRTVLARAEKTHGVSPRVISSLLWIESRHGKNKGRYHVPSVYAHLIQAPRPEMREYLLSRTGRYTPDAISEAQRQRILDRTGQKAEWAMTELKALEKVHKWKWTLGSELRGSFSGAFGIPQFIPSSYVRWARSINHPAQPNLSSPADAIMSVAYYLKDHGWKADAPETHVEALMKYNNSRDYANAILALAERVEVRRAASETKAKTGVKKKKNDSSVRSRSN